MSKLNAFHIDLKAINASHMYSFVKSVNVDHLLSEPQEMRHSDLQSLAMKWLFGQGYVVASEVELPNKLVASVAAVKDGHVVIVEVIVSSKDYK